MTPSNGRAQQDRQSEPIEWYGVGVGPTLSYTQCALSRRLSIIGADYSFMFSRHSGARVVYFLHRDPIGIRA